MSKSVTLLRDTKVQLRMRPLQKQVARAADLRQTTLTNFMVEQAFDAAPQILADQVHFYPSPKKWDERCAALDARPKDLPGLRKLLTEPSVFDEPEWSLAARVASRRRRIGRQKRRPQSEGKRRRRD